tara:strand:- start:1013 stop:1207 length:195 start_codon:yes stop_codon:yes gene_type:complete
MLWKLLEKHPDSSAAIKGTLYSKYFIPPGKMLGEGSFAKVKKEKFLIVETMECAIMYIYAYIIC